MEVNTGYRDLSSAQLSEGKKCVIKLIRRNDTLLSAG